MRGTNLRTSGVGTRPASRSGDASGLAHSQRPPRDGQTRLLDGVWPTTDADSLRKLPPAARRGRTAQPRGTRAKLLPPPASHTFSRLVAERRGSMRSCYGPKPKTQGRGAAASPGIAGGGWRALTRAANSNDSDGIPQALRSSLGPTLAVS